MLFFGGGLYAQKQSAISYLRQKINGTYIPKDLDDCIVGIDSMLDDTSKIAVLNMSEKEFLVSTHFGLGLWIRNNWELWGGSRLSRYFNSLGIYHPDDVSGIILTSYYRYLNGKDRDVQGQIKYYQDYWNAARVPTRKEHPEEAKRLKLAESVGYRTKDSAYGQVHIHANRAGEIWLYHYRYGWIKITEEDLDRLKQETVDKQQVLEQIYKR